jgi:hypothetical protein
MADRAEATFCHHLLPKLLLLPPTNNNLPPSPPPSPQLASKSPQVQVPSLLCLLGTLSPRVDVLREAETLV